jgi:hypothetical protein
MLMVFILFTSINLQLLAAVMAIRLIRQTGQKLAWSLIAAAPVLMTVRRDVISKGMNVDVEKYRGGLQKPSC